MLSRVINSSPLPTFAINKQHKVTSWNAAIEILTGTEKKAIIGTNGQWRTFYAQPRPTLADLIVDGASADEIESYYQGKCAKSTLIDGAYEAQDFFPALGSDGRWVRFTASPIRNDNKQIIGAIEILEDITERIQAEEALSQSEQRFRDLTETTPDMIWEVDTSGVVTYVSPRAKDLMGYEPSEVIGKKPDVYMVDPGDFDRFMSIVKSRKPFSGLIFMQQHKDGHQIAIESSGVPYFESGGKLLGYRGIDRDITERTRIEQALRESERSYRELFEVALDAIWVHDLNGEILKANAAMEQLTGYRLKELIGNNESLFMSDKELSLAVDVRDRLLRGEAVVQPYEQHIVRKDGTEVIVMFTTGTIYRDGRLVAFQHIARDITEQKRMQENLHHYLREITRAQEEERKRISRDLHDDTSQSLLLMIHRLDALISQNETSLSKPLKKKLAELYASAVDTHSRLRSYTHDLRPAILDDLGLVAALEWIADNMKEDGTEVSTQLSTQRLGLPHESELVLFRIAQEALNNIRKHARASEVGIRLEIEAGQVKLSISDNGRGFEIPPDLTDFGGTGKLGIVGMQERAQLLGGTFSIQSELGKGTTIVVMVPA